MDIDDDADMLTIARATVDALRESARHIGKADRSIDAEQIREIEAAIAELQNALRLKDRT